MMGVAYLVVWLFTVVSFHLFFSFKTLNILFVFVFFLPEHNSNESGLHFGVRVEGIDELISNTKFSRQELQRMYRGFKNVRATVMHSCSKL